MAWLAVAAGLAAASARAEPPPPAPAAPSPVDALDARPPPARPPVTALRSALHALPCALLTVEEVSGGVLVSGTVAGEAALSAVREALGRGADGWEHGLDVAVASANLCAPLTLLAAPLAANAAGPAPLRLRTAEGGALRKGDFLLLDLTAPAIPAHLRVDYFTTDGHVVHLLPNPLETGGPLEAGATRRLGERTAGGRFWSVGPPFGQELLVALATPAPLFATPRPEMEPAAVYLEAVKRALADLAPDAAPLASALFITTEP